LGEIKRKIPKFQAGKHTLKSHLQGVLYDLGKALPLFLSKISSGRQKFHSLFCLENSSENKTKTFMGFYITVVSLFLLIKQHFLAGVMNAPSFHFTREAHHRSHSS
jgi:hypothetical protein